MFWRIFYGFLRLTGLAQCFAGGYPCCCSTSGSTSSKPPPPGSTSTSTAESKINCSGCSFSDGAPDLLIDISGAVNGTCGTCAADVDGAYVISFTGGVDVVGGISGGRTWRIGGCSWSADFAAKCGAYNQIYLDWQTNYFVDGASPHYRPTTEIELVILRTTGAALQSRFILDNSAGDCEPLWDCMNWNFTVPFFDRTGVVVCNLSSATVNVTAL